MKLDPLKLDELTAGCKTPADVATLYSQLLQRVLDRGGYAEMDAHLGHERHEKAPDGARKSCRNGATLGDLGYGYDASGNRTSRTGSLDNTPLPNTVSPIDIVNGNRLKTYGSDALSYDNNGNLSSDGSNTYTWNARGELIGISGAVTASFRYDAFGRRRGKTVNGTERKYLYDGANAVQEINTSGNPTQHFLTGLGIDEVFVRTNGSVGAKRLPLTDALGSTLALAMTDGSFAASYAYEPYGAATISGDPVGYPFTYTGREDDGTGLYYYRARYYSPEYGRFISEDPIGFAGGINTYLYANANPISFIDPLGLASIRETLAQMGAVGPIDAYTAYGLANQSLAAAQNSGLGGLHNGPADAFRHCLWSCMMADQLGSSQAKEIGDLHERYGNNPQGEQCMDLNNNAQGRGAAGGGSCSASCSGLLGGGQLQTAPGGTPPSNVYTPY